MSKLYNKISSYLFIIAVVVLSSLLVWLPFLLKTPNWLGLSIPASNFEYVLRHFDGPLYVIVAKTLYDPAAILSLRLEVALSPIYFAAHLPLYPLLIRLFAEVFGYLKSMLFVNVLLSGVLGIFFYEFLPRFMVVRSVGAPESLFILLILGSLFFFEKGRYVFAGILGALATATKTPGILLFVAYSLVILERLITKRKFDPRTFWLVLIPMGLVSVFLLYQRQLGDFFAYFKSGDNIHLLAPYSAFNFQKPWVGTAWLEDILFYFFLYVTTIFYLKNSRHRSFFYFTLVFTVAVLFVQHRDIARYSLPLWVMFCITFERFLTSKKFFYVFLILLPAIFMYAWNFMLFNIMPVSNWAPFL